MKRVAHRSIVFIIGSLVLGGAEKQLFLLAVGLKQRGWEVSVITLHGGFHDYWEKPLIDAGIKLHGIPTNTPRLIRLLRIRDILAHHKSTFVHSWSFYTNAYAAIGGWLASTPVRLGSERANQEYSLADLGRCRYELCLRGLDAIVVNSRQAARFLRAHRPGLRVFETPNGQPYSTKQKGKSECRRYLHLPDGSLVVGAIGSLEPRKNFGDLIDAMARLLSGRVEANLVIIGDGPSRADLLDHAHRVLPQGRYYFPGALPNAWQWLLAFDVFCMPSLDQEGMPNVLLEAAAAALPIVATRAGATPDLVEHGKNGLLVAPGDIAELASALERLLRNKNRRTRLGRAALIKVKSDFQVDSMIESVEAVYASLLEPRLAQWTEMP